MKILGFEISRVKAGPPVPVSENRGGWWPVIRESFTGAWQSNVTVDQNTVLSYHAVYSCMTLIASDISKLRIKLVEQTEGGIWQEVESNAFSPVLRKPNRFQNRIQFMESWVLSKLTRGNTYVLKVRDSRSVVVALYVLDPTRVKPLVADDGSVFHELNTDNMAAIGEQVTVPASEIIHDRFNCLFHPLIGTSPIYAAGVAATQGLAIQNNSTRLFSNQSRPGGMLTAPGAIGDDTAKRLKEYWETNFTGENYGKIAVAGDGLKFESIGINAVDSQLIEQLKWTAEVVCSTFHVPPYKIGVGQMPTYSNIQSLNVEYYSQCLQGLIESAELCLDEGLGLVDKKYGTEFDIENLLRMDTVTQMSSLKEAVSAGVMSPNEARKRLDLPPAKGGESPMIQQQNYSLEALAKRDSKEDPFGKEAPKAAPAQPAPAEDEPDPDQQRAYIALLQNDMREALNA